MKKNNNKQRNNYATYFVAMKILVKKNGMFLFLRDVSGKRFDLPGGRIDANENFVALNKIIAREVREELGKKFKYELGPVLFQYRRIFQDDKKIFITVYEAKYLSGEIKLSDEHTEFQWIDPKYFKFGQKDFLHKEEYLAFKKHFSSVT
jgi:8-oxo-dGTP diphosphatase